MAKDLPYFKFTPTFWLTGDISFEELEIQGLFIGICAIYWHREGVLSLSDIEKRFKNKTEQIQSLVGRFMKIKKGNVQINFLDEQFIERGFTSKKNKENGKKGGRPRAIEPQSEEPTGLISETQTEAKITNIEEEKNKNKKRIRREESNKVFIPPSLLEFQDYFLENGFKKEVAERAWKGYDVADWYDSQGKKVKSWKQKCQNVWFKDENKSGKSQPRIGIQPGNYTQMFHPKENKY